MPRVVLVGKVVLRPGSTAAGICSSHWLFWGGVAMPNKIESFEVQLSLVLPS